MLRHADDITLNHLIELRKLEAQNEKFKEALEFYKCSCTEEQFKTCTEYMCGHRAKIALKEEE